MTVTDAVEATCAELFDAAGTLTINGTLTAASGAAVRILDPENLSAYVEQRNTTAVTATGGIVGTFRLLLGNSDNAAGWVLAFSADGRSVLLKHQSPMTIVIR